MSESSLGNTIYAIDRSTSPPGTWIMEWNTTGGIEIMMPPGYVEVTGPEYQQAIEAQQRASERFVAQAEYAQRMVLSEQRKALVDTGMTYEQACIIIPDLTGDYSVDDGWRG